VEQLREENVIGTSLGAPAPVTHQVTNHEPQEVEKTSSISFGEWRDLEARSEQRFALLLKLPFSVLLGLNLGLMTLGPLLSLNKLVNEISENFWTAYLLCLAAFQFSKRKTGSEEAAQGSGKYMVNLWLSRNGYVLGTDVGTVIFQDGFLIFEGANTSFSFSTGVIDRRPPGSLFQRLRRLLRAGIRSGPCIRYLADGTGYELRMKPRDSNSNLEPDFKSWLNWPATPSHDVLPPRVPTRGSLELNKISMAASLTNLFCVVGFAVHFVRFPATVFSPPPLFLNLFLWLALWTLTVKVLVPYFKARSQRDILAKDLEQARASRRSP
jgi:hypothetical protein